MLPKRRVATQHTSFNPAAVQRQIQALCNELLTLACAKGQPARKPQVSAPATRTFPDEATKQHSRTSCLEATGKLWPDPVRRDAPDMDVVHRQVVSGFCPRHR